MYKIKRTSHFTDMLELEDGENTLQIPVEIEIDKIVQRYRALEVELMRAQKALKEKGQTAQMLERIGQTVVDIFTLLFGEENTGKILSFYDGNHIEMLGDVYPYILQVIVPKLKAAALERKQQYKKIQWMR